MYTPDVCPASTFSALNLSSRKLVVKRQFFRTSQRFRAMWYTYQAA